MVTVQEILSKVDFDNVFVEYKKHYEEDHKEKVMDIFQKLKEITPIPNDCNMVLSIRAIKENELGDDVVIDSFDCDDKDVFFDVYGKADDYEGLYSIASSAYEDLLGYYVSDNTLNRFTPTQIVSHILWALDW
jgi:hypothetical protein